MNLTLTKDTQQDLNDIRALVITKDYQAFRSDRNRLKLSEVYREVMAFSGFKVDGISAACPSCINEAINIVYNYVMHHEQLPDNREAKVIEVAGGGTRAWGTDNKYPEELMKMSHERKTAQIPHTISGDVGLTDSTTSPTVTNTQTGETFVLPEDFDKMEYSDLMQYAKLYGHTGKRISKEALIEFLTDKVIPKSE